MSESEYARDSDRRARIRVSEGIVGEMLAELSQRQRLIMASDLVDEVANVASVARVTVTKDY